jgi:ketosteroid isomerase-like protein
VSRTAALKYLRCEDNPRAISRRIHHDFKHARTSEVVSETELIAKHFMFGPRRRLERQGRLPRTYEDTVSNRGRGDQWGPIPASMAPIEVVRSLLPSDRRGLMHKSIAYGSLLFAISATAANPAYSTPEEDRQIVESLDTEYQAAVKRNDVETMGRILHDDMVLVLGDGRTYTKAEILESARGKSIQYEYQDEDPGTQIVRVWGDTAVVTARLWIKGHNRGVAFDRRLWFSDTYVRTPHGWKYAFGQASLKLPDSPSD